MKKMNNYNYDVNFKGKVNLTVVAENKEEADRILKDTMDSIIDERFKSLFNELENIEVKNVSFKTSIENNRERRDVR